MHCSDVVVIYKKYIYLIASCDVKCQACQEF